VRVVLDTNVYISAILFGGNCEEILRLANLGSFDLLLSKDILLEIKSVLKNKFNWTRKQVTTTISYLKDIATEIKPDISLDIVHDDPSDNKVIECALAGKAHYIVTGDRNHLLPLKKYKNIKIISPAEFLRL
jgi:putative PIN family toxin of toxin-antitoxin system